MFFAHYRVYLLVNPVVGGWLSVLVKGACSQSLILTLTDIRDQAIDSHQVPESVLEKRHVFDVSRQPAGLLLLKVSTSTESRTLKVLRDE